MSTSACRRLGRWENDLDTYLSWGHCSGSVSAKPEFISTSGGTTYVDWEDSEDLYAKTVCSNSGVPPLVMDWPVGCLSDVLDVCLCRSSDAIFSVGDA